MKSTLAALNDHLRDENNDRRARIQGKGRGSSGCLPGEQRTSTPTPERSHADIIAEFHARQAAMAPRPQHVEGARYRVRFRQFSDAWRQVRHFASLEDRRLYVESIKGGAEILEQWEAPEPLTADERRRVEDPRNAACL